jgi:hypothetical protein
MEVFKVGTEKAGELAGRGNYESQGEYVEISIPFFFAAPPFSFLRSYKSFLTVERIREWAGEVSGRQ